MIRLSGQGPLGRQVYLALRESILSGELKEGIRLPSTRALAEDLGVSRTVTQFAYEQLMAEGYLVGRVGSGTRVTGEAARLATSPPALATREPAPPHLSRAGGRVLERAASLFSTAATRRRRLRYDFRPGLPPLADFPHEAWRRLLGRQVRRIDLPSHDYGPAAGSPALREALADYLRRVRALGCSPEQIVIVNGSQQGIDLAVRLLVDPGDAVVMEEPGYEGARNVFALAGVRMIDGSVDGEGLDIATVSEEDTRLAYVTPSHQFPTGAVMTMARRAALLDWAERRDAWILEDDYDGEFRFGGKPLAPLQAIDRGGRVVYLGTFSKVMFPSLRVGYLVLPPSLVRVFTRAKPLLDGGASMLVQEALAEFVSGGGFELYVRRLRTRMAERRAALLEALAEGFGDSAEVLGAESGLHVLLRFRDLPSSVLEIAARAAVEKEVGAYSAAPYYRHPPAQGELVMGYAALTPAAIREGVRRLAAVVRETR